MEEYNLIQGCNTYLFHWNDQYPKHYKGDKVSVWCICGIRNQWKVLYLIREEVSVRVLKLGKYDDAKDYVKVEIDITFVKGLTEFNIKSVEFFPRDRYNPRGPML